MQNIAEHLTREFDTSLRLHTEDVITESPIHIMDRITTSINYLPDSSVPPREHIEVLMKFLEIEGAMLIYESH